MVFRILIYMPTEKDDAMRYNDEDELLLRLKISILRKRLLRFRQMNSIPRNIRFSDYPSSYRFFDYPSFRNEVLWVTRSFRHLHCLHLQFGNIFKASRLTHFLREFDEKNGVTEAKRRLAQYIRSKHAEKKTEIQFWLDIEEILSCYKNVGSRQWNLSSIWSDFQCGFGACPRNNFTAFPGSKLPIDRVKKDNQRSIAGNMFSQLDNNELHCSNGNVSRDPEFQHDYTYEYNQHMRKEIVRCLSSFVVSTIIFLGISYYIWNSQLSIIHVLPLHKEHDGRLSIWSSLLGLFGFMVFVCAVAVMILVGAPFTSMQKAMLIFLAIMMHLQSANSIIEVFVTLVGGLFMAWYSFGKSNRQMK